MGDQQPIHMLLCHAVRAPQERARGLAEAPLIAQHGAGAAVGRAGAGTGPASKAAKKAVGQTHLSRKREQALQAAAEEAQQVRCHPSMCSCPSIFYRTFCALQLRRDRGVKRPAGWNMLGAACRSLFIG